MPVPTGGGFVGPGPSDAGSSDAWASRDGASGEGASGDRASGDGAEATAVALARELGFGADTVEVLPGGNQNHVVRLRTSVSDVVVRLARDTDRLTMDPFEVEQWCARAAAAAGIATPAALARSRVGGHSVIVHEFVPGTPATADDLAAWAAIGRVAGVLAGIDLTDAPGGLFSRFGRNLEAAWQAHLDYNLVSLSADDQLLELGVYTPEQRGSLRRLITGLRRHRLAHGLVHGDLSTRNLIADPSGGYVVLDWGSASAGPTPWTDLELIRRWHVSGDPVSVVSADAWRAVQRGAGSVAAGSRTGMAGAETETLLDELQILHVLDVVRWAIDNKPERIAELVQQARHALARVLTPTAPDR
jgi:aminoglycoside phosphotransferase (APT) family kinase protein